MDRAAPVVGAAFPRHLGLTPTFTSVDQASFGAESSESYRPVSLRPASKAKLSFRSSKSPHDPGQSNDAKFLRIYPELLPTPLQLEEDLEQLKVLQNGYKMKAIMVDHEVHVFDTPKDVGKIERFMRERNLY